MLKMCPSTVLYSILLKSLSVHGTMRGTLNANIPGLISSNYRWTFKKHDWNTGRERVWLWFYTLPMLKITVEAAYTCKNTTNVCALHAILFKLLWTLLLMGFHSNWKTTHSIYIITRNIFCQRFLFLNKSYKNLHILDWKGDPSHPPLTSEPA